MQNRVPTCPAIPDFTPVPRKYRHDGWTPERQRAFIAALAETGSVRHAAKRVNMSPEGAYALRQQPGAESLCAAWQAALDHGVQTLADLAIDRAIEGVPVPVFWRGDQVGEKRRYNDRLLMFILQHHLPGKYGATALKGGTKSPETIAREAEADEAWLRAVTGHLAQMLGAQRRLMRCAVIALLTGDQPGAAQFEERARRIEAALARPDDWGIVAMLSGLDMLGCDRSGLPEGADKDTAPWCAPLDEAPNGGIPDPDAPTIHDLPRDPRGYLLPRLPLPGVIRNPANCIMCGPTLNEREAARATALRRIEEAQAEWLAAVDEEAWAAWRGTGVP